MKNERFRKGENVKVFDPVVNSEEVYVAHVVEAEDDDGRVGVKVPPFRDETGDNNGWITHLPADCVFRGPQYDESKDPNSYRHHENPVRELRRLTRRAANKSRGFGSFGPGDVELLGKVINEIEAKLERLNSLEEGLDRLRAPVDIVDLGSLGIGSSFKYMSNPDVVYVVTGSWGDSVVDTTSTKTRVARRSHVGVKVVAVS